MDVDKKKLIAYIKRLSEPKILVVGDLAIDEMIYGDTERISREAPAAHNAATLNNGKVEVIGVCGDDYQSGQLEEAFRKANVSSKYMVKDPTRKTTTKTRISGQTSVLNIWLKTRPAKPQPKQEFQEAFQLP